VRTDILTDAMARLISELQRPSDKEPN
jgi:hypothetical protein